MESSTQNDALSVSGWLVPRYSFDGADSIGIGTLAGGTTTLLDGGDSLIIDSSLGGVVDLGDGEDLVSAASSVSAGIFLVAQALISPSGLRILSLVGDMEPYPG